MSDIVALFKALADPTRLAVYNCIRCCGIDCAYDTDSGQCCGRCDCGGGGEEVAACHIRCQVPCAPSTLTHHLNELRAAGLIETEKRGRVVYCRIRPEALVNIGVWVTGK